METSGGRIKTDIAGGRPLQNFIHKSTVGYLFYEPSGF